MESLLLPLDGKSNARRPVDDESAEHTGTPLLRPYACEQSSPSNLRS
jgi:hypothetical protein